MFQCTNQKHDEARARCLNGFLRKVQQGKCRSAIRNFASTVLTVQMKGKGKRTKEIYIKPRGTFNFRTFTPLRYYNLFLPSHMQQTNISGYFKKPFGAGMSITEVSRTAEATVRRHGSIEFVIPHFLASPAWFVRRRV